MTKRMTAAEVKASFFDILDEVENGEQIEITRHGLTVARLTLAREPHSLNDMFAGVVSSNARDEDLFSTGVTWNLA